MRYCNNNKIYNFERERESEEEEEEKTEKTILIACFFF